MNEFAAAIWKLHTTERHLTGLCHTCLTSGIQIQVIDGKIVCGKCK